MNDLEETLYGTGESEDLHHSVEDLVGDLCRDASIDDMPWPLTVVCYRRRSVKDQAPHLATRLLEDALERLDDEFGGEEPTQPTQSMKDSAMRFAGEILGEYVPWQCEPTGETVEVPKEWAMQIMAPWGDGDPLP